MPRQQRLHFRSPRHGPTRLRPRPQRRLQGQCMRVALRGAVRHHLDSRGDAEAEPGQVPNLLGQDHLPGLVVHAQLRVALAVAPHQEDLLLPEPVPSRGAGGVLELLLHVLDPFAAGWVGGLVDWVDVLATVAWDRYTYLQNEMTKYVPEEGLRVEVPQQLVADALELPALHVFLPPAYKNK
jgi:hypothetical protein